MFFFPFSDFNQSVCAIFHCDNKEKCATKRDLVKDSGRALRGNNAELVLNCSGKWMSISIGARIILNMIMPVQ